MTSRTLPRRLLAAGVAAATLAAAVPVAAPADADARTPHVSGPPPNRVALVERGWTTAPSPTAPGVSGRLR